MAKAFDLLTAQEHSAETKMSGKLFTCMVGIGLLFLEGCASVPMTSESLDAAAKSFTPPPGKANIYLIRSGATGTAVALQTSIDGGFVGLLAMGTYQLVAVDPGEHQVSSSYYGGSTTDAKVSVQAGINYFFAIRAGTRARVNPLAEQDGRRAVLGAKRAKAESN